MSVKFENLIGCDLHLDEVYEGGNKNNVSDDVISKILKTGNSGGFRIRGKTEPFKINYCALCSSLADQDWPDSIDVHNGIFTYFGDNRKPGPILNTKNKGNLILEESFLY